jgi:hypothetical protein
MIRRWIKTFRVFNNPGTTSDPTWTPFDPPHSAKQITQRHPTSLAFFFIPNFAPPGIRPPGLNAEAGILRGFR